MNFVSLCLSVPFEFPYNVFVFLLFFIFKCDLFFRAALGSQHHLRHYHHPTSELQLMNLY